MKPETGQIVLVRSRQYLVEEVSPAGLGTLVRLSCVDDDAQGQPLDIFWETEVNTKIFDKSRSWELVAKKGFDCSYYFSAYLHSLKWNLVTSTDPKLFQAPYRAGIEIKAYQLEPLRKALQQPRVSLFIADDVGLGKTIEAGLVMRELLMRQKIKRIVIACPPSVVRQWQEEMENRFGLLFKVFDRQYVADRRRERGFRINPWTTFSRFIISHSLLRDEYYAAPLRQWLGNGNGSMLILDEAHNAAPASSSRYAIDSQLTKVIRAISPLFEHKLFLSATPHNGHSNSFAALLEMLDPQRFCRGVPINDPKLLDAVMVRRLKQDLREIGDSDFPKREIISLVIDNLDFEAAELKLARLLQQYRTSREERLKQSNKRTQAAAMLVLTSLQKRLLSSIEAFARTLTVHRKSLESKAKNKFLNLDDLTLLKEPLSWDDERAELSEADIEIEENEQITSASQLGDELLCSEELDLLEQMDKIAQANRYLTDSRTKRLIQWIEEELKPGGIWNERRVVIFTEYADTKRYLENQLRYAFPEEPDRLDTFTGGMGEEKREQIKAAFNADPNSCRLRILIATDAAREGVNLQNYCADLFHFDIPWNPSRMEQRNGRIDRKLQRYSVVRCHYFYLPQRPEDRVLDVLVKKTATILQELGSLAPVIEKNVEKLLDDGIKANEEANLAKAMEYSNTTIDKELESIRIRRESLIKQQNELEDMLSNARKWLGLSDIHFRDTISAALEIVGFDPLQPLNPTEALKDIERAKWSIGELDAKWADTLDSLRVPRTKGEAVWDWRQTSQIRPVVFRDPGSLDGEVVHLHLEHRLVQRLLSRLLSQGYINHELARSCVCLSDDPIPKAIILGRLSLFGEGGTRLHDEIVAVAVHWLEPETRGNSKLRPLGEEDKKDVLKELEISLATPRLRQVSVQLEEKFKQMAHRDIEELKPHLDNRSQIMMERAKKKLSQRGQKESQQMRQLLEEQRARILKQIQDYKNFQINLFNQDELRQLEADRRHWEKRVEELATEIVSEPERIDRTYQVKTYRLEPAGLVYLWPVSN